MCRPVKKKGGAAGVPRSQGEATPSANGSMPKDPVSLMILPSMLRVLARAYYVPAFEPFFRPSIFFLLGPPAVAGQVATRRWPIFWSQLEGGASVSSTARPLFGDLGVSVWVVRVGCTRTDMVVHPSAQTFYPCLT